MTGSGEAAPQGPLDGIGGIVGAGDILWSLEAVILGGEEKLGDGESSGFECRRTS